MFCKVVMNFEENIVQMVWGEATIQITSTVRSAVYGITPMPTVQMLENIRGLAMHLAARSVGSTYGERDP